MSNYTILQKFKFLQSYGKIYGKNVKALSSNGKILVRIHIKTFENIYIFYIYNSYNNI